MSNLPIITDEFSKYYYKDIHVEEKPCYYTDNTGTIYRSDHTITGKASMEKQLDYIALQTDYRGLSSIPPEMAMGKPQVLIRLHCRTFFRPYGTYPQPLVIAIPQPPEAATTL